MKRVKWISILALGLLSFQQRDTSPLCSYPSHFPEPSYDFTRNPLKAMVIDLGRKLFYDPLLSRDNSISCASCHSPYNAFAHTDHDLSHGIRDQIGNRNAPALFNLAWQNTFMWDGAVNHLDVQALAPITHPKEMDETLVSVIEKLNKQAAYRKAFKLAFSDSIITGERILKALSQFQLTLVSANARYDKVKSGGAVFTEQEEKGYRLFQTHCNSCHTEPLFTNGQFVSNGLPVDSTLNDAGRGGVTKRKQDSLLFKVPSLRNLSYTYPYMHDGRFKKLYQVLAHYTSGDKAQYNLDLRLRQPFLLNSVEKTDLVAFLLTLNDTSFVFNAAFRDPFTKK